MLLFRMKIHNEFSYDEIIRSELQHTGMNIINPQFYTPVLKQLTHDVLNYTTEINKIEAKFVKDTDITQPNDGKNYIIALFGSDIQIGNVRMNDGDVYFMDNSEKILTPINNRESILIIYYI